jgi:hypothetical protein
MPSHLELDFSRIRRAAFGSPPDRNQVADPARDFRRYEVRQEIGAEHLKEELVEGRMALPDDLLVSSTATKN